MKHESLHLQISAHDLHSAAVRLQLRDKHKMQRFVLHMDTWKSVLPVDIWMEFVKLRKRL